MTQKYEAVIGLEIHAELMTNSKMFSGAPVVDSIEAEPNTAIRPMCLAMPGTLPVVNKKAIEYAAKVALALNCEINLFNRFARKNYFYPDLAKGYQISQYEEPIGERGYLDVELADGTEKRIRVRRVHMEEDTGKLTHTGDGHSLVDYNRAGVPLLEIVSEPDIDSAETAYAYATRVRQILRYLEVNSGDLEKGVLRVEPNISIRPKGTDELNTRTEVKNLNSFRVLQLASKYEIERQTALVESGGAVVQETRGWNEERKQTFSQRLKEDEHDYRYFPDPDLPPLQLDPSWVEAIRATIPELPKAKKTRYIADYNLSAYDARVLTEEKPLALWFEQAVKAGGQPKAIANWLINNLSGMLNESGQTIDECAITPATLVGLTQQVEKGVINNNIAKKVLVVMFKGGDSAEKIIADQGLAQVSDETAIIAVIDEIIAANAGKVAAYQAGKTKLKGFFVGQVMRAMRGKANPAIVNQLLDQKLSA